MSAKIGLVLAAYFEGVFAFEEGIKVEENPYKKCKKRLKQAKKRSIEWDKGWNDRMKSNASETIQ